MRSDLFSKYLIIKVRNRTNRYVSSRLTTSSESSGLIRNLGGKSREMASTSAASAIFCFIANLVTSASRSASNIISASASGLMTPPAASSIWSRASASLSGIFNSLTFETSTCTTYIFKHSERIFHIRLIFNNCEIIITWNKAENNCHTSFTTNLFFVAPLIINHNVACWCNCFDCGHVPAQIRIKPQTKGHHNIIIVHCKKHTEHQGVLKGSENDQNDYKDILEDINQVLTFLHIVFNLQTCQDNLQTFIFNTYDRKLVRTQKTVYINWCVIIKCNLRGSKHFSMSMRITLYAYGKWENK